MTQIKDQLNQLQQNLDKKDEEIRMLKISNMEVQAETKLNKINNLELKKKLEGEIHAMGMKTNQLETHLQRLRQISTST